MFHANTQRLIEDWRSRRGPRPAPARADISPAEYREILPQIFILGAGLGGALPFRLAGGLLVDLHDRELRGACFLSLWPHPDRRMVAEAIDQARRAGSPAVVSASAWTTSGEEARLEVVLAPLIGPSGEMDRVLGLYQPTSSLRRLLGRPVHELTLRDVKFAERGGAGRSFLDTERPRAHLRLVALDGILLG